MLRQFKRNLKTRLLRWKVSLLKIVLSDKAIYKRINGNYDWYALVNMLQKTNDQDIIDIFFNKKEHIEDLCLNPNFPEDMQLEVAKNGKFSDKRLLAKHTKYKSVFDVLKNDEWVEVLDSLLDNSNVSVDIIEHINDSSPFHMRVRKEDFMSREDRISAGMNVRRK